MAIMELINAAVRVSGVCNALASIIEEWAGAKWNRVRVQVNILCYLQQADEDGERLWDLDGL